jgi:hypothetical protein
MADELRLPDIPNAGYSTHNQKELSDAIMFFMRGMERERLTLLTIVLDGLPKWRKTARSIWRGLGLDDTPLDAIYHYFELQACPPRFQVRLLQHQQNPLKWREIMREAWPDIEQQAEALRIMEKWTPFERRRGGRLITL